MWVHRYLYVIILVCAIGIWTNWQQKNLNGKILWWNFMCWIIVCCWKIFSVTCKSLKILWCWIWKSTKITITPSTYSHYPTIPLACALYDPHHDVSAGSNAAAGPWWGTHPHHSHPASAMYGEDTTGQNTTTHHHSPPLLSHNPNPLLSIQQHQQQPTTQTPLQSSQTNGTHTNGTVASSQPQQIVPPSVASDSPVSPPTGKKWNFFAIIFFLSFVVIHNFFTCKLYNIHWEGETRLLSHKIKFYLLWVSLARFLHRTTSISYLSLPSTLNKKKKLRFHHYYCLWAWELCMRRDWNEKKI